MEMHYNIFLSVHFSGGIKKFGIAPTTLPADPQGQISERGTCPT